jgi:carbonic anhydrase
LNLTKLETNVNLENVIFLKSYSPVISHPFDDLMRDIIVTVYQENVGEIVVVTPKDSHDTIDILSKLDKSKELQQKIQTLDYLFKNTRPEFPGGTVREWLQGDRTVTAGIQKTLHIIRNHPLLPSHVTVKEWKQNGSSVPLTFVDIEEDRFGVV